jgi:hypothetical protein
MIPPLISTRMENSGGREALGKGAEQPAVRPTMKATAKAIRYAMTFHALYTVYCVLYIVYCISKINQISTSSDAY